MKCNRISYNKASKMLSRKNCVLLDIRPEHKKNSTVVHVPFLERPSTSVLFWKRDEVLNELFVDEVQAKIDPDKKVIITSQDGSMCALACSILQDKGYKDVTFIEGGLNSCDSNNILIIVMFLIILDICVLNGCYHNLHERYYWTDHIVQNYLIDHDYDLIEI